MQGAFGPAVLLGLGNERFRRLVDVRIGLEIDGVHYVLLECTGALVGERNGQIRSYDVNAVMRKTSLDNASDSVLAVTALQRVAVHHARDPLEGRVDDSLYWVRSRSHMASEVV